ncbi:hypothetical protein ERO13_A08G085700v2 [Gossypium hirsutum]|uniref:non-specific serine/threonine protein kinase n=1 Tax=Gossypium hirsutum TaxID=3635 RepID=A0A1U8KAC6_GOSHI|nr:probable serine/threonine-protein kinase At1g01540 isoform X1 [Gossypium hirsutum]KAG4187344.1 hypothetical protein ERO13_A08G085700v2 [Gossypium hirsutum]
MSSEVSYLSEKLSNHTSFLGLPLWILILAFLSSFLLLSFSIVSCYVVCYRRTKSSRTPTNYRTAYCSSSLNRSLLPLSISEIEINTSTQPELQVMFPDQWSTRANYLADIEHFPNFSHGVPDTWTSNRFSLRDVDVFTNGFAYDNLIGNGYYGVVYRGVLLDGTTVAVKRLPTNSCQTEGFVTEAEAIGHVRHKNLVKLLGYCMEQGYRMLVYEYVNNSNLHQWLHGPLGQESPLTWTARMNIIHGIAKGLAYLHEDIEPHIVHQNLKANNILLDHLWNPKISDAALSRLLGPDHTHGTTPSLVKLGYAAEEHGSTSRWDKKSDVYSFGILVMELVSGRMPVDHHHQPQIYLIDWLKSMVANKKIADVVDPKMPEIPSVKELKRITLIAFRCVDPDLDHRPKMGEVIHMLEPRDLLLNDERRIRREASLRNHAKGSRVDV